MLNLLQIYAAKCLRRCINPVWSCDGFHQKLSDVACGDRTGFYYAADNYFEWLFHLDETCYVKTSLHSSLVRCVVTC